MLKLNLVGQTVTFDPIEPQKRQSTINDSTLHQKFIYAIRKTKYTVVLAEKRWQILCPNYHYFNSTTSFYWFQYCVYLYTNYKQINFQILFNYCHSHSLSYQLVMLWTNPYLDTDTSDPLIGHCTALVHLHTCNWTVGWAKMLLLVDLKIYFSISTMDFKSGQDIGHSCTFRPRSRILAHLGI